MRLFYAVAGFGRSFFNICGNRKSSVFRSAKRLAGKDRKTGKITGNLKVNRFPMTDRTRDKYFEYKMEAEFRLCFFILLTGVFRIWHRCSRITGFGIRTER